jgi:hypothetical protein
LASEDAGETLVKKAFLPCAGGSQPVILAAHEGEIRRIAVRSQLRKIVHKPRLKKTHYKKGLVEWLKV